MYRLLLFLVVLFAVNPSSFGQSNIIKYILVDEASCPLDRPISLQSANWDSIEIQNAIHETLWRVGFNCETVTTKLTNSRNLLPLTTGKVDYYIEIWSELIKDIWRQVLDNQSVVVLGTNFSARKGWFIPNYMQSNRTGIEYFSQLYDTLPAYAHKSSPIPFFVGGRDWSNVHQDLNTIEKLGLQAILKPVYASSESEQERQVMHAMLFRKPFVVSSWEPSAIASTFNLTRIGSEANSKVEDIYKKSFPVFVVTSTSFYDQYPDVANIIGKLVIPEEIIRDLVAKKFEYGWTPTQAAQYFYVNYASHWRSTWGLFPQVAKRIRTHYGIN